MAGLVPAIYVLATAKKGVDAGARTVNVQSERICAILNKMERIVAIGEAADVLGVSIATLRRWEAAGKLAAEHTAGGHRRDDVAK
jgi:excisionase family DNA binding protein